MYKAYKFRIYPSKEQRVLINKNLGCKRFVYNYFLNENKNTKKLYPYTCINILNNNLKNEFEFLKEVDSLILNNAIFSLSNNIDRYTNSGFGFPKFKSKHGKNSYTTTAVYGKYKDREYCNIEVNMKNKTVKLPKLKLVKIRGYRKLDRISGKIKNATISREPNGKYYVSILCEIPDVSLLTKPNGIVGIDVGVKQLITLSDGMAFDNEKYIEKYEKRIKRCQKELSRKEKGSNNYYKCKQKLARLYSKLANARKYYTHKITKTITEEYDIIACENLNTKSMIEQKVMSKKLTDATLTGIIRQLEYKSKQKGKYFYKIDTYYPSSQTCSVCNHIDKKYKNVSIRTYECSVCNNIMDRDLNASINIMFEGLKQYMTTLV